MADILIPIPGNRTAHITEPVRTQFPRTLGGAVEYTITHFVFSVLKVMGAGLGEFVGGFLVHFLELVRPELVLYVGPFLDDLLAIPNLPPGFRAMLEKVRASEGEVASSLLMGLGSTAGGAAVGSIISTLMSPATYALNRQLHPARPSPAEAWTMYWRGVLSAGELHTLLNDVGWPGNLRNAWGAVLRPRLDLGTMLTLYWRKELGEDFIRGELSKRGWADADISRILRAAIRRPGVSDLISFAVREAWRDDVAAKYGLDQDFVPQFGEELEKQGFSKEWAKRWWRAHWRLPGLRAGQEMLWRTSMTEEDYKDLLRFADLPVTWRQWLLEIAYNPYTRVDVRRMHKFGVLTDEDLIRAYKDIGYDDEKASKLAAFTIAYNTRDESGIAKSEILKGYKLGILSQEETHDALTGIGYSSPIADFYTSLVDYQQHEALLDQQLDGVKTRYTRWEVDKSQAIALLNQLGLTAERVTRLLSEWDIHRDAAVTYPTKADLARFYKLGIITETEYREGLQQRGYTEKAIQWYYQQLTLEMAEEWRKEQERADKERERIAAKAARTAYEEQKAEIDYQIAKVRTHLAEIKALQATDISPELKEELQGEYQAGVLLIRQLLEQRARLKLD